MRLRPVIKKYQEAGNSEKSHKEGPTPVGGCLVGGAFGMKDIRVPGSVQNLIRQDAL